MGFAGDLGLSGAGHEVLRIVVDGGLIEVPVFLSGHFGRVRILEIRRGAVGWRSASGEAEAGEDPAYDGGIFDRGEQTHRRAARGTPKRADAEDAPEQVGPADAAGAAQCVRSEGA